MILDVASTDLSNSLLLFKSFYKISCPFDLLFTRWECFVYDVYLSWVYYLFTYKGVTNCNLQTQVQFVTILVEIYKTLLKEIRIIAWISLFTTPILAVLTASLSVRGFVMSSLGWISSTPVNHSIYRKPS